MIGEEVNMKSNKILHFVLFFFLLTSVGCQKNTDQKLPGIELSLSQMNAGIELLVPEVENNIIGSPFIGIVIVNSSDNIFRLNEQIGILIFEYVDNEWIPINNLMDYGYGEDGGVYLENKGPFAKYSTVITPAVTVDDENILMRIVCLGEFISPDGKVIQQAGAYRDFWLTPDRTVLSIDQESL